jgi:hypothetical protein
MNRSFPGYWYAALATCLLELAIVALVCLHYDPANLFGDKTYEAGVARLLASGENVANVTNYDERQLQRLFIRKLNQSPDVIVLGSSRTMQIGAELFPGRRFFNHSVSGASIEDYFAIYELYAQEGFAPKQVVLDLDAWLLNRFNGQTRWESLRDCCLRSLPNSARTQGSRPPPAVAEELSRYRQLISFAYLRAALNLARRADREFYPTRAKLLDVNIRLADGTIAYGAGYRVRSPADVAAIARREAARVPVYSLGNFRELDPEYVSLLELFISRLQAQHVEILLFMPPYHPDMYEALVRQDSPYAMVAVAERYFRALARRRGIPIVGSFNPALTPCSRAEFYDGMHARPPCIRKIIAGWRDN